MNPSLRSNLIKFYAQAILGGAATSTSIVLWVVFLQQHYGFTLAEVALLDIPFWLGKFVFEIPTGVVADKYGRRLSLALSNAIAAISWVIFSFFGSFWVLAATQVFGAMGATFASGAYEALLYETMKGIGRESEYARTSARIMAVQTVSAMVCGVGVGFLATVNMVLPVFLSAVLFALTTIPILLMKETLQTAQASGPEQTALPKTGYTEIVRQAFNVLRGSVVLRWAAAYLVIISCVSFYVLVFLQPYTIELGLAVAALGPVMVGMQVMSIAGSLAVGRAEKAFGVRNLLFGVPLLLVPLLLATGLARSVPSLLVLALASFLFSLTQPVLMAEIQGKVSNEMRATLLSIQSLLAMVFLILTEPALGLVADHFGVHTAYLAMAGLLAIFCIPLFWKGRAWLGWSQVDRLSVKNQP